MARSLESAQDRLLAEYRRLLQEEEILKNKRIEIANRLNRGSADKGGEGNTK